MTATPASRRLQLKRHVRYRFDRVREQHQLVFPEGLIVLNETAAAIARCCDGRTVDELYAALDEQFGDYDRGDVEAFLGELARKGFLHDEDS